jgi:nucleotide-binding universal stress UspA family protein
MFRHLLVPLDGSSMAEGALPAAAQLARKNGARLTLVHVVERNAPSEVHSDRHLVGAPEAGAYLQELARRPLLAGLRVETHVHEVEVSDVARSISEHAAELAPDLVVMSTHGRGSARRMFFGAIGQQVIGLGDTPVLLLRPAEDAPGEGQELHLRAILVPIDGDPAHERALPVAEELARSFTCRLDLLMVVPTIGALSGLQAAASMLLPNAMRAKLEMDSASAFEHVQELGRALAARGVQTTSETSRGDPARAIISAARRLSSDLVVMGTHGRAGTDAFWEGSVAARVVSRVRAPLLLVPLKVHA